MVVNTLLYAPVVGSSSDRAELLLNISQTSRYLLGRHH